MNDADHRITNLLKVQASFIPLFIALHIFNLIELKLLCFKMLVSYSFSVALMGEFAKYLEPILISRLRKHSDLKGLIEYVVSLICALITFLIIHLLDKEIYILFILIILIIMFGYVLHLIFKYEEPPKNKK